MGYLDQDEDRGNRNLIIGSILAVVFGLILLFAIAGKGAAVTQEEFEQVRNGMTYDQVVAVIGEEGTLAEDVDVGFVTSKSYHWEGPSGATVLMEFMNGRLVAKMLVQI